MDHRVLPHRANSEEAEMKDPIVCLGGVDWANDAHAVSVVDDYGHLFRRVRREHSAELRRALSTPAKARGRSRRCRAT
jgi:hypothetical protein